MNLVQYYQKKNDCYKKAAVRTPVGIMWHETGAVNPELRRYVGPDDGALGKNQYSNDWNRSGADKCAHAFIGKLADGSVATYQTLPFEWECWLSGTGGKGKAANANRNGYIQFEICRGSSSDTDYFKASYREALELSAYLCRKYSIPVSRIIDHAEGHRLGIASNHGDVTGWFGQFGVRSMDQVRADVQLLLDVGGDNVAGELRGRIAALEAQVLALESGMSAIAAIATGSRAG